MAKKPKEMILDLPKGWQDQTVYVFAGPEDDGMDHTMMVMLDRQLRHKEVAEFAREKSTPITESIAGIDVLKDEETTIEDGNQSWEFAYKWIPGEGLEWITRYVFVIKNGIGYTFTARFSKMSLKTVGLHFMSIIESLVPGTYEPLDDD